MPVNYALVDDDIVFRTSEGTKLQAATQRAVIASRGHPRRRDADRVVGAGHRTFVDRRRRGERDARRPRSRRGPEANAAAVRLHPELITAAASCRRCHE
jgi:hypothetical protein